MTDYDLLRTEIEKQVKLDRNTIQLGGKDVDWYRVQNPDHLLDAAASTDCPSEQAELDPFWAVAWRAALGLDQFLGTLQLDGVRVLELGCGSGQAGVGAAMRGALVTMTDIVSLAMDVAKFNARPVAKRVSFKRLNWTDQTLDAPKFPIILGSDLVYDTSLHSMLLACASRHLAPEGTLLLSEPYRHTGDAFASWIATQPWQVVEHRQDLGDGRIPIRIFSCKMSPAQV
ncbi:MAG: hypothetical protein Aurels2KO_43000 [Aureliella sp.]